jgi:hypothetical protein
LPPLASKRIRAGVIRDWCKYAGYPGGVVCFSCGNASAALEEAGLQVVNVSPTGSLVPTQWWSPEQIHACWPHLFDATSGHLPISLMAKIGEAFACYLPALDVGPYIVPSGSGETLSTTMRGRRPVTTPRRRSMG